MLTLAGLLVAILYSPIGNTNDYSSLYYYSANPGVQFTGGIANAPKTSYVVEDNSDEVLLPISNDATKAGGTKYTVSTTNNSDTEYGSAAQINSTGADRTNQSSGLGGANVAMAYSSGTGKSSSKQIAGNLSYGFTSISSDLTSSNTNTVDKQSVPHPYGTVTGGTDPGGDPLRPPIPVGDGWILLLFFAGLYVIVKRYFL